MQVRDTSKGRAEDTAVNCLMCAFLLGCLFLLNVTLLLFMFRKFGHNTPKILIYKKKTTDNKIKKYII